MDLVSSLLHVFALSAACRRPPFTDHFSAIYPAVPLDDYTDATAKHTLGHTFGRAEPFAA